MGMRMPNQIRDPEAEERRKLIEEEVARKRMQQDQGFFDPPQMSARQAPQNWQQAQQQREREGEEQRYYSDPRNTTTQTSRPNSGHDYFEDLASGAESLYKMFGGGGQEQVPPGWHPPQPLPGMMDRGMPVAHARALVTPQGKPVQPDPVQKSQAVRQAVMQKRMPQAQPQMLPPMSLTSDYGADDDMGLDAWDLNPGAPESNPPQQNIADISPAAYDDEGLGDSPMPGMDFDPGQARDKSPEEKAYDRNRMDIDFLRDSMRQQPPSNRNYANLLMKSAAQAGSVGGKIADTSGFDSYTNDLNKDEDQQQKRRGQVEDFILKARSAQAGKKDMAFEREKFAYQQQKDAADRDVRRDGYQAMNGYRQDMLDATRGRDSNQMQLKLQEMMQSGKYKDIDQALKELDIKADNARASAQLGLTGRGLDETSRHNKEQERIAEENARTAADRARKNGEHLDPSSRAYLTNLSTKNAGRIGILNDLKSLRQQFANAKTPQDKYNVGQAMLKTMNSLQGADAIGKDESARQAGDLENMDLSRLMRGESPIGMKPDSFLRSVDARINSLNSGIQATQKEIESITGGGTPGQSSIGASGQELRPGMKWQQNKRTGERRQVPIN